MSLPISVIIPTHRRPALTAQALLSVYRQTELPREVLIVDDGSPGSEFANLQQLCAQVATRFSSAPLQLRVETLHRHLGMPGAVRNIGILRSSETWLAFLDSDDVWLPQKLQQQWLRAQQSGAKIIHCRELWLRFKQLGQQLKRPLLASEHLELLLPSKGQVPQIVSQKRHKHRREGSPRQLWPDALKKCIVGPSTLLLHRSACDQIGYFEPKLQIAEDYEYLLRLLARFEVAYCPEYLIAKRDKIPTKDLGIVPQLSHKYPWIEPFRIAALEKLLLSPRKVRLLSAEQRQYATAELRRKLNICLLGARKRLATNKTDTQAEIQELEAKLTFWTPSAES